MSQRTVPGPGDLDSLYKELYIQVVKKGTPGNGQYTNSHIIGTTAPGATVTNRTGYAQTYSQPPNNGSSGQYINNQIRETRPGATGTSGAGYTQPNLQPPNNGTSRQYNSPGGSGTGVTGYTQPNSQPPNNGTSRQYNSPGGSGTGVTGYTQPYSQPPNNGTSGQYNSPGGSGTDVAGYTQQYSTKQPKNKGITDQLSEKTATAKYHVPYADGLPGSGSFVELLNELANTTAGENLPQRLRTSSQALDNYMKLPTTGHHERTSVANVLDPLAKILGETSSKTIKEVFSERGVHNVTVEQVKEMIERVNSMMSNGAEETQHYRTYTRN